MSNLRQNGLTLIEVALAVMISTLVMTAVWLQLQDMIKFYLSRNTAYTINARFDHVVDDIKSSCLIKTSNTSCEKDKQIKKIEMENSSGGMFGELNVKIQEDTKAIDKKFDIWITYNIKGSVLQHIDRRMVRNNTAFYYVAYCDVIYDQNNEDKVCKKTNKSSYYYSPVMPWSVSKLDWLNKPYDDHLIFHYVLSL
ncbi:PulJ/GspJ family protein [Escherichia coli]|uniref:PulJ/GspJ family protein n=1 Tax=Escherichia coli TaxID=562 RepID=UPI0019CE88DA|nr:prepilin-type N-terminal cleavage/methylation domain-containing protein [Escherichia coli]EEU9261462.1 prepilin-type N-terminal cleavage/methylation domain-containing protein [Escherichia coli]EIR2337478.1 prepilin-type N-terminal cleavage/methylation domain-containing protein [Escherichia coli]MCQ0124530.1 prepilin-type N-terminal cleavage/methylation domain-containing protein [Escherichia coli]MCQ0455952.1 prepilin-type N-terminal cleavage/methylation domain-containing protein [Escherichia